jgi:deoxyadenosine/deoxycytidine kinase
MKIGFCGTVSVGKTTLVHTLKQLPEFENYEFATERSKYLRDLGIPLNTDSTIKGQMIFMAERASELFKENIITDRTIIDVMAFTNKAKSIPTFICDEYEHLASNLISEYDYIFYISPEGVEIEENGVRETDAEYRMEIDKQIQYYINKYSYKSKRSIITITGSTEERIEKIKQVIFP